MVLHHCFYPHCFRNPLLFQIADQAGAGAQLQDQPRKQIQIIGFGAAIPECKYEPAFHL
ncbi:hypothetical protein D3C80_1614330 [compost metagenome]